ncbi:MAG: DUF5110 domain-containing protein, partial [Flavobacteriales bacterium]|nr:DUF5110 domain-containing protein [Flavobacteriales bacterium]
TDEFIFGEQIFVCPILEENSKGRRLYLPRGNWYNYWNNEVKEGGKEMWVDADLDTMPIFVKEGSVIPKYPIQQYVGEKQIDQIGLDVYYKFGKEVSLLYDDDNDGYDYTKGRYSLRTFKTNGKKKELIIRQHKSGKFMTTYDSFKLNVIGLPFKISKIEVDKEAMDLSQIAFKDNTFVIPKDFSEVHIMA